MRTHECNRPNENFQYYDDEDCMKQLARLVDVYTMLAPYIKTLVAENAAKGVPVQRPMFLHYEQDLRCYDIQYQYMLGSDMVVAPVYRSGQAEWPVYLPEGEWVHLWTGVESDRAITPWRLRWEIHRYYTGRIPYGQNCLNRFVKNTGSKKL